MRWYPPSDHVQAAIAAPIVAAVLFVTLPFWMLLIAALWIGSKIPKTSRQWHRWFAWYPVKFDAFWRDDVDSQWLWLETVERRARPYGWETEYRPCDSDRSGEAGETGTGSTEGESAGPEGIAHD